MKMTLNDVKKNVNTLAGLAAMTFPGKLKYAVAYNFEKLGHEEERIEKQRLELCRTYADKDENGEPVMTKSVVNGRETESFKMSPENEEAFKREYADLLETEVDIDIRTVHPDAIDLCETSERYNVPSVAQIIGMSFMIEDVEQ